MVLVTHPRFRRDLLKSYRFANTVLARGGNAYTNPREAAPTAAPRKPGEVFRQISYPRVGIYVGRGASHSWLWLVDLLEIIACYDVGFVDQEDIREGALRGLDVVCVGGGDTFAIAEELGYQGAGELQSFLEHGGVYLGSCAGAYLLLDLSGPPFEPFAGFTDVQLGNVSVDIPPCRCMPTRFSSPYNGMHVIHPVREGLLLKTRGSPFFERGCMLGAPLYGGPAMIPSPGESAMAWYHGFTDNTLFLGDKKLAEDLFFSKAAIVRKESGEGTIWLFGPHCEHPYYPEANRAMVAAMYAALGRRQRHKKDAATEQRLGEITSARKTLKEIKRHVSNARIMAQGLELESPQVHWFIGNKSYEPEKIRVFLEAVWKRLLWLLKQPSVRASHEEMNSVLVECSTLVAELKELAQGLGDGDDMTPIAERLFSRLKKGTAAFLKAYLETKYFDIVR